MFRLVLVLLLGGALWFGYRELEAAQTSRGVAPIEEVDPDEAELTGSVPLEPPPAPEGQSMSAQPPALNATAQPAESEAPDSTALAELEGGAGAVVDLHFEGPEALHLGEGDQEAVEAGVEAEGVGDLAPEDLEGAARVADGGAGEGVADSVGDAGLEALVGGVVTLPAPAVDDVDLVFVEGLDHRREVGGVDLEVAVHHHDVVAARGVDVPDRDSYVTLENIPCSA